MQVYTFPPGHPAPPKFVFPPGTPGCGYGYGYGYGYGLDCSSGLYELAKLTTGLAHVSGGEDGQFPPLSFQQGGLFLSSSGHEDNSSYYTVGLFHPRDTKFLQPFLSVLELKASQLQFSLGQCIQTCGAVNAGSPGSAK